MVTLIKHEKEAIINSKNVELDYKKSKRELKQVKEERCMLQKMTTEVMYGMIESKQNIKEMRE